MCSQWGEAGSAKYYTREMLYEMLPLEHLKILVQEISDWKPTITLFGGEPLMYKGLFDLIDAVKSADLRCNMITNGVMLKHFARDVVNTGVDEIIWSLDGPQDIHDHIRGRDGTFNRAVEGIKEVVKLRALDGRKSPVININSTLFESNYQRMDETIKVAEEVSAATITFHHLIFLGAEQYAQHNEIFQQWYGVTCTDWAGFLWEQLPEINPETLISHIRRIESRNFKTKVHFYPNLTDEEIRRYYTDFEFTSSSYRHRCLSPWMVAYIMPSGEVRPCYLFNYSLGNIKEMPFKLIWNDAQYRRFRQITKKVGLYPACDRCTELYRF
jgi:radical SAM protein with 4Fe4S-binding SPASM domain